MPDSPNEWIKIAEEYESQWNFPHCLGSMDGKHVVIQAPFNSGSEFFNYKQTFSIVLFALVDADYNFLFIDTGCQGRISDGGVFKDSALGKKMKRGDLFLPEPTPLPGRVKALPYFFLGDSAFALSENLLKPFSGEHAAGTLKRIFNYRLSRARRVVENVFGITSSVFRILRKPIVLEPEKVELVVMTIAYLHNYLRRNARNIYTPPGSLDKEIDGNVTPGTWRNDNEGRSMTSLKNVPRRTSLALDHIRHELGDYFINEGKVSWQNLYA